MLEYCCLQTMMLRRGVSTFVLGFFFFLLFFLFFFFFFQAEDGIRDGTVTGVQTCALPISRTVVRLPANVRRPRSVDLRPFARRTLDVEARVAPHGLDQKNSSSSW